MKTHDRLEQLYREISQVILSRQHPVTGLLPASTSITSHGDYTDAWVRDNVYSIIAPWALSQAFRKQGDTVRQDELEQATIKLMRGLLQSMMRQSDKVETFKNTFNPIDALHAKYDTRSGLTIVADDAWGHLQIDATSIYLLMLAQMTAAGLRIIRTHDEVDFIQNLIYYVAIAYRCPDYGIWERGNKINNGKTEINASSVGMAKAALQALDGLNLFGLGASPRAVVHTVADSISLARNSLAALLPRESLSKEVDSALLSIIGFPAFAVGDQELATKTRDEILKKLGGNYGCKRFLWDGHQTSIEDPNRLYYEHSELANFEHVESEWPLFFSYLYINALFSNNQATAKHYRNKLESVMVDVEGIKLIPELYYLPPENIAAEKQDPGSQERLPNENLPLVWAQSIYYTALLIDEGFLETDDLDRRQLRANTTRFNQAQIALVVLAENEEVKRRLAENGVIAESLDDIRPIKVISAPHLVEAYAQVGANGPLNLSGRPRRRLQSLATSQTYDINNQRCLCLSWIQSEEEDYRMRDAELVSSKLKKEIAHIRKHWLNSEAAVFTLMMTQELCLSPTANVLYRALNDLQLRTKHENVGYASASLAFRASRENRLHAPNICLNPITGNPPSYYTSALPPELEKFFAYRASKQEAAYQKITDLASGITDNEKLKNASKEELHNLFEMAYEQAQAQALWLLARQLFCLLQKSHTDLADYLSVLSARHFSVIVGSKAGNEFSIDPSLSNAEIVSTLESISSSQIEHCLLQEVLAAIGALQRTKPKLFEGLRSIQLHSMLKLCSTDPAKPWNLDMATEVGKLSPGELMNKIESILETQRSSFKKGLKNHFVASSDNGQDPTNSSAMGTDWFEWRVERGLIVTLDRDFLEAIWKSLAHADQLILGDIESSECVIDCALIRKSMTAGEEIFAKFIDDSIQQLHPAYYKSVIVEGLLAFTRFCEKYPNIRFNRGLNLNKKLEMAAEDFCSLERRSLPSSRDIDLFLQEPPEVVQYYFEKALVKAAEREMDAGNH